MKRPLRWSHSAVQNSVGLQEKWPSSWCPLSRHPRLNPPVLTKGCWTTQYLGVQVVEYSDIGTSVSWLWCSCADFRIYIPLYLLIPYAFARIHLSRGSATNVRISPRAWQPPRIPTQVVVVIASPACTSFHFAFSTPMRTRVATLVLCIFAHICTFLLCTLLKTLTTDSAITAASVAIVRLWMFRWNPGTAPYQVLNCTWMNSTWGNRQDHQRQDPITVCWIVKHYIIGQI